uniref:Uncharacterized protein n=1 Tax=Arundo donax TaxID=35708 RepID=A0A0A8Z855_ARUDO
MTCWNEVSFDLPCCTPAVCPSDVRLEAYDYIGDSSYLRNRNRVN